MRLTELATLAWNGISPALAQSAVEGGGDVGGGDRGGGGSVGCGEKLVQERGGESGDVEAAVGLGSEGSVVLRGLVGLVDLVA